MNTPLRFRCAPPRMLALMVVLCLSQHGCQGKAAFPKPSEHDVLKSFFASPWLPESEFTLTSVVSDCGTGRENTSGLPLRLHQAFLHSNTPGRTPIELGQLGLRRDINIADKNLTPSRVRIATGMPVITVSRVGIWEDQAVLCVRIYAENPVAYFVSLDRIDATRWKLANQFVVWEPDEELLPEEFADDSS